MDYLQITGGAKLSGSIKISGAKNIEAYIDKLEAIVCSFEIDGENIKLLNLWHSYMEQM